MKQNSSSIKSYGIHDPDFLKSEVERLSKQFEHMNENEFTFLIEKFELQKKILKFVDLGCGTGDFLSAICAYFNKAGTGVEITEKLFKIALTKKTDEISFVNDDIFNYLDTPTENTCFVLRYVAQHLGQNGCKQLIESLTRNTRNCFICFIDSDNRLVNFIPNNPPMVDLFEKSHQYQLKHGGSRHMGFDIINIANELNLTILDSRVSIYNSSVVGCEEMFTMWRPVLEREGVKELYGADVIDDLISKSLSWSNDGIYCQGGLVYSLFKI